MGNNPVIGVDPDGRYSRFGAWWRSGFSGDIYKVNSEWGYNTVTGDGDAVNVTFNYGRVPIQPKMILHGEGIANGGVLLGVGKKLDCHNCNQGFNSTKISHLALNGSFASGLGLTVYMLNAEHTPQLILSGRVLGYGGILLNTVNTDFTKTDEAVYWTIENVPAAIANEIPLMVPFAAAIGASAMDKEYSATLPERAATGYSISNNQMRIMVNAHLLIQQNKNK